LLGAEQGLAAAALISLPHGGGPGAPSLAEEAGFVSAAQAALWKMERKHGVHDTEAWTAAANASIALLEAHMAAPPGGILAVQAERTSRVYYQKEETKGIHDPDAVHVDNVLDSNARKSARAHARWAATKKGVEEEDDYKDQDLGRLLGSAHADERGAVQATRVLAAPVGSADAPESAREKAYHARELEEKAKEAKILAKAESARKEAHDIAEERKVKPAAAISSHEDAANHKTASGTPGGTVPSAAAAAPTSPSDGNVTSVKGEADSESTKGAATGKVAPGMLCLKDGGLNDQELNDFTSSTVCVGWEIKRNIGLGDTVHMMKVSLLFLASDNCVWQRTPCF
jgi:hypothetical protein